MNSGTVPRIVIVMAQLICGHKFELYLWFCCAVLTGRHIAGTNLFTVPMLRNRVILIDEVCRERGNLSIC